MVVDSHLRPPLSLKLAGRLIFQSMRLPRDNSTPNLCFNGPEWKCKYNQMHLLTKPEALTSLLSYRNVVQEKQQLSVSGIQSDKHTTKKLKEIFQTGLCHLFHTSIKTTCLMVIIKSLNLLAFSI